jgi:hypothetical protein
MALCWHQNFMRNLGGGVGSVMAWVALCCRVWGGGRNLLEKLIELKQKNDLETYIKDFDILWNRSEISEKNALVFFIRGLEVEVKNLIKMFEPKTLKQAYTYAHLQDNTLTHRRYSSNPNKQTYQPTTYAHQSKPYTPPNYNKSLLGSSNNTSKPFSNGLLSTPPPYNTNQVSRITRPIKKKT